jgi:cytochrome P450
VILPSCHYLHDCLNEALRTMPAVPSETIRVVLPGGFEVDGEFPPEGVLVASTPRPLHHSDKAFRSPWIYRPERWMSDEASGVSKEDVSRAHSTFSPICNRPSKLSRPETCKVNTFDHHC